MLYGYMFTISSKALIFDVDKLRLREGLGCVNSLDPVLKHCGYETNFGYHTRLVITIHQASMSPTSST